MYIQHFGLVQYPFSPTPNTQYFFKHPSHVHAFEQILKALQNESCFSKVTGEVGTGKTLLCRKTLNALKVMKDRYITAHIPNPVLNADGIMLAIAEELGLQLDPFTSYYDLLKTISAELLLNAGAGKTTVLFIDEAQAMPEESLEAIRLLTTIQNTGESEPPLRVILFGQAELEELLQRPALRELYLNVNVSAQLTPLHRGDIEAYLTYRLTKAGYSGTNIFSQTALDLIHSHSKGVPRNVNQLAHKALSVAFEAGEHTINDKHIETAIAEPKSRQSIQSPEQGHFNS